MAEVSGKAGKGAWYRGGGRGGHERHLHVADVALLGCHTPDTQREKGMARQHTGWAQGLKMECVREDGGGKWRGHKGRHKMGRGKEHVVPLLTMKYCISWNVVWFVTLQWRIHTHAMRIQRRQGGVLPVTRHDTGAGPFRSTRVSRTTCCCC